MSGFLRNFKLIYRFKFRTRLNSFLQTGVNVVIKINPTGCLLIKNLESIQTRFKIYCLQIFNIRHDLLNIRTYYGIFSEMQDRR